MIPVSSVNTPLYDCIADLSEMKIDCAGSAQLQ